MTGHDGPPRSATARLRRGPVPRAWDAQHPSLRDLAVALVTATVDVLLFSNVLVSSTSPNPSSTSEPAAVIVGFGVVGGAILLWRRRYPCAVLTLLCVHSVIGTLLLSYRSVLLVCVALVAAAA